MVYASITLKTEDALLPAKGSRTDDTYRSEGRSKTAREAACMHNSTLVDE